MNKNYLTSTLISFCFLFSFFSSTGTNAFQSSSKLAESAYKNLQYKKALKVHPEEPYIYYNIGRLYLDMKQTEQAKDYFRQALEKDPGFDEAKQVIKAIDLGLV